jgi:Xaa-Pro dipeptidase
MMDHCSILHHIHHDRHPVEGDASLLVDAGAAFNGYASDITRTWVRGYGSMTSLFRDLVSGVDRVQRRLVEGVVVGRRFEDLHNEAHVFLAELLIDLKVLSCGVQQALESGLSRLFFPHGLGHSLGIQVHDVGMKLTKPAPENPFLRNTSELTAGQVVTIEPGVYFIPQLMKEALSGDKRRMVNQSLIEGLMPFGGVRIEDDILVTAKGALNLTRDLVSNQD